MRIVHTTAIALAIAGLAARITVGCAASEDAQGPAPNASDASDDALPPVPDSAVADTDASDASARKTCSGDGWCHTVLPLDKIIEAGVVDPATASIDLRDVWVTPEHEAWAVARQGYVLRWKAGAWELVFDTRRPLRSVWAASSDDVWIAGEQGLVLHGTMKSGVLTFETVDLGSTEAVLRIRATSPTDVWAVTRTSIYRSAGMSFTSVAFPNAIVDPSAAQQIGDVWIQGKNVWIGAQEFTTCDREEPTCHYEARAVLIRWKGGDGTDASPLALWERVPIGYAPNASFSTVIVAGSQSPDGTHFVNFLGASYSSWTARIAAGGAGIADASPVDDASTYAWALASAAPSGTYPDGVWAAARDKAWLVASPGTVRHWDGESWKVTRVSITTSPLTNALHTVSGIVDGAGKSDVWIVGEDIAMHRSELP